MAWTTYRYKANSLQVELWMFIVSTQFQPKYQQDFFFSRTDKLFLRFKQKYRVAKIASFQNKQPSGRTHTSWFQSVSKATIIKMVSQRNRSADHNENPEIDLSIFSQLIFHKGIKAMAPSMKKKHLFSKWVGKTRKKYRKKKNDPCPLLHITH